MALFRYNSTTNKLVPITSEGSVGIPVGAVMAFAAGTSHENWLECNGRDTTGTAEELQTHYPALYTYLGNSNVLPAQFDHDVMSDIETVNISQTSVTMQYDGIINGIRTSSGQCTVTVNGTTVATSSLGASSFGNSFSIPFNKGDVIASPNDVNVVTVRYYKQPLYIKATSAGIEVDKDLYATKGYIRDQNILSDYEVINLSSPVTMQYDGFLSVKALSGMRNIYINDVVIASASPVADIDGSGTVAFKKGDVVRLSSYYNGCAKVAYYKLRDYTGR